MKKITLLAFFTLTLFTVTFGVSPKNTVKKDLSFLTQSFTSKLFYDTIPESNVTIISLDYAGDVTFNTPPSPIYGTLQVIPYNTISRRLFVGPTNITFNNNSTLPFYVYLTQPGWYLWYKVTEEGFQIPNYFLSGYYPVTIKIGTDLSLLL